MISIKSIVKTIQQKMKPSKTAKDAHTTQPSLQTDARSKFSKRAPTFRKLFAKKAKVAASPVSTPVIVSTQRQVPDSPATCNEDPFISDSEPIMSSPTGSPEMCTTLPVMTIDGNMFAQVIRPKPYKSRKRTPFPITEGYLNYLDRRPRPLGPARLYPITPITDPKYAFAVKDLATREHLPEKSAYIKSLIRMKQARVSVRCCRPKPSTSPKRTSAPAPIAGGYLKRLVFRARHLLAPVALRRIAPVADPKYLIAAKDLATRKHLPEKSAYIKSLILVKQLTREIESRLERDAYWTEVDKIRQGTEKMRQDGEKFWRDEEKVRQEGEKLRQNGEKLRREGEKLRKEGEKLKDEIRKLWAQLDPNGTTRKEREGRLLALKEARRARKEMKEVKAQLEPLSYN